MTLPLFRITRMQLVSKSLHFYCSFCLKSSWPVAYCRVIFTWKGRCLPHVSKHVLLPVDTLNLKSLSTTFPLSSVASTQFVRDILSHACLPQEKTARASALELNSSFQYRNTACLHQETMTSVKQRLIQLTRVNSLLQGTRSVKQMCECKKGKCSKLLCGVIKNVPLCETHGRKGTFSGSLEI